MNRVLCFRLISLMVFAGIGLALGCGSTQKPLVPVSGKVTVDGKPLSGGQVTFVPEINEDDAVAAAAAGGDLKAGLSAGTIESNGSYKIYTGGKAGAPLGKYKVTVTPSMVPSPDGSPPGGEFNKKYSSAKDTPLRVEVVASPKADQYDLKLTK